MHTFLKGACRGLSTVVAAIAMIGGPTLAQAENWKFSTGADYSRGDYGDGEDTKIQYLPFTAAYSQGPWTVKTTISHLEIEGPGTVIGAGDGGTVVSNTTGAGLTKNSGLGDTWASLTYSTEVFPVELGLLDLTAKVKLPTADEDDGLGTGEVDYTLQADLFHPMGSLTPFATLAYKVKGDPSDYALDNVWYLSGGGSYKLNAETSVGASLDFQQASSSGSDDALELFGYISYRLNDQWSVMGYTYLGLSDGSPDHGLGAQLTYRP